MKFELGAMLSPVIRRWGLFCAWFLGLLLLAGFLWLFTQPLRNRALIRSVNRVLSQYGEDKLEKTLLPWGMPGRAMQAGTWYSVVNSEKQGIVFSIMREGRVGIFLGIVSPAGRVDTLIPLSNNAIKMRERLPEAVMRLYIRRIELSNALIRAGREKR
ncbi:MAG: hypothetical protein LBD37_03615 [Treponema sp.]|jgi:hypothetical protein|nr:hypothetical protein [Treponema sp.]